MVGRGHNMQIPGAGCEWPWALGTDPRFWLQPKCERVCRAAILGSAFSRALGADSAAKVCSDSRWVI